MIRKRRSANWAAMCLVSLICQWFVIPGDIRLFADEGSEKAKITVGDGDRSSQRFEPLGVPDYTTITGFVKGASLPTSEPYPLWNFSTQGGEQKKFSGISLTGCAVADGVIYFGDELGNLTAIDTTDETELWTTKTGSRISVKPSVDADFVYLGSKNGIKAVSRRDGTVVWDFVFQHGAEATTPIPVGEFLYASGYDGNAYCLRRATGAIVWRHNFIEDAPGADHLDKNFVQNRARMAGTPAQPNGAACDGELFIQSIFDQGRVIAVDCKTGARRWSFQARGWISPAPTIAEDRVYVVSQDKHLYCVKRQTGELIWKYDAKKWLASQVAVREGKVYLPVHGARLHQISADSGELIRIMEPSDAADRTGLVYSFPLIAGQTVCFACGAGTLFAFDIESGQMKWKLRPSESSELFTDPVTDGRNIYVTSRQKNRQDGENAIFAIGAEE